ncbi:hypothetical protein [Cellulomonas sp. URHD0024]|uniref:hypothetical protein n=1 Tax=Cellulomonas sp. URHD0024 TaxID=1302620 RepID=UPI0012DCB4E4|nr:hypothetical protein [Cellulomonas sp. URHD0024]
MTTPRPASSWPGEPVYVVYHYNDGHDFVTETVLRAEVTAYMPLLCATPLDADHYVATFGTIEVRAARG